MESDQCLDINLGKIRTLLKHESIKLWLHPYYNEKDGSNTSEIKNLSLKYSKKLILSEDMCKQCIENLQATALVNLKEKEVYENTGVATFKVKVPVEQGSCQNFNIKLSLTATGGDLKKIITEETNVPNTRLKLVAKGKVVKDDDSLDSQSIKHGAQIMAIILNDNTTSEANAKMLNSTVADIEILNKKLDEFSDVGGAFMEIADQTGKPIQLPKHEKQALTLALALHEKGRAALKRENYALALVMLLEAEVQFGICNCQLLKQVDNYGLLNLDIAWCYLNLQSVNQLPDAEARLLRCEESFQQSYGRDMERLIALKGSTGTESALFMRLHLLQGIVYYHQGRLDQARQLLNQVEKELAQLQMDDTKLSCLMEVGYTVSEARLALRACNGDLNAAAVIIENKRAEKKQIDEDFEKSKQIASKKEKLGKCKDGSWIEPEYHKALLSMGFTYKTAQWALAETNNSIPDSITLMQNPPELDVSEADISLVTSMGFELTMAKRALRKHAGNIQKAVEELAVNCGSLADDRNAESDLGEGPSTSKQENEDKRSSKAAEREAYARVAEDIDANNAEDHLDLTLTAEAAFLKIYKDLLSNV